MISPWETAADLSSVIETIEHRLQTDAGMSPGDAWRLEGVRRGCEALGASTTAADRGVWLREITRLADGHVRLPMPGTGLDPGDLAKLSRFGLRARMEKNNGLKLWIADDDPLPDALARRLGLDTAPRRLQAPTLADAALRRLTPFSAYRSPTQKAAVRALMSMPEGAALSVTMPTGAGKSLVFQLGVRWWREAVPGACALVIVPTVALAYDQARGAQQLPGLEGSRALTGDLDHQQFEQLRDAFVAGEVPLLFVSPELAMGRFARYLEASAAPPDKRPLAVKARLMGLIVDEAHIIESWGRNFRPDFQRLPGLLETLREADPSLRVVLLSATLGDQARRELQRAYGGDRPMLEIDAQVPRYELDLVSLPQPSATARDELVLHLLDRLPRPAIVYTTKKAEAAELRRRLQQERGYRRLALFTGDTDGAERKRIIHAWSAGGLDLVVATSAFGLGIDKANVRAVVHACVPENPARWYQEVGRAARDGHQGIGVCVWHQGSGFHDRDDVRAAYGQALSQWMTVGKAMARWRSLLQQVARSRWDGEQRILDLNLDAIHADVDGTCDYNQRWNMALLNSLQRAGAIRVRVALGDDAAAGHWSIEVLDPRILGHDAETDAYLQTLFGQRDADKLAARRELDQLRRILEEPEKDCMLTAVFAAVETGSPSAAPCGRCDWCRANELPAPNALEFRGLGSIWDAPAPAPAPAPGAECGLRPGMTVITPWDPDYAKGLEGLLRRLAAVGIEQYVVPTDSGVRCAELLEQSSARIGFVLEHKDLLNASGWALGNLPTALLLAADQSTVHALYQRGGDWQRANPELALALVAPEGLSLDGRPLEQLASVRPPYPEAALDDWAAPYPVVGSDDSHSESKEGRQH